MIRDFCNILPVNLGRFSGQIPIRLLQNFPQFQQIRISEVPNQSFRQFEPESETLFQISQFAHF